MNIACPECQTVYRIDPSRVPERGIRSRCRECDSTFLIEADASRSPGEVTTAAVVAAASSGGTPPGAEAAPESGEPGATGASVETGAAASGVGAKPPAAPAFGPQDPQTRARRLARALVSDIKVYNPEKWEQSRAAGTLRTEFREEVLKSWEEYVEQVGEEMAKKTPYFRDALNDILAAGTRVF